MSTLKTLGAVKESTKQFSCNANLDGVICDLPPDFQYAEFDGSVY